MTDEPTLAAAADAIRDGDLVVYPTETVYGLGGDALDPAAVERVFAAKGRDRSQPISLAVPSVAAIDRVATPTERELSFCRTFLPGPVTVLVERRTVVPDVLVAGRERVGVRVPADDRALALLERASPITATSANLSGRPSARRVEDLDDEIREAAAVVVDGGETPGGGSTVVNVAGGEILRRGARVEAVEDWLATDGSPPH